MKKLVLVIILLFIIILIGVSVFLLTFDANRYKPFLIEKIEDSIKKDVRIGNISLNIFPRLSISIQAVSIKDTDKTWDNVILEAGAIDARVKILPLIRKDVQIEHLVARGLDITLEDNIKVNIIEAILKNISLYGPIDTEARISFFGRGSENVKLKGLLYPDIENKKPYVKNLEVRIDLDRFDLRSALNALGQADIAGQLLGKQVTGELVLSSEKIFLDPDKVLDSYIYISLPKGATDIVPVKEGLRDIEMKAEINNGDIIIQRVAGVVAGGRFSINGTVKGMTSGQNSRLDVALQNIDVSRLLPDVSATEPRFEGIADIDISSSARGLTQDEIVNTLTAKGKLKLDNAMLRNMNILTVALDKLDMLPGLVEKLKRKLPEYYKELLKQNYTSFRPLETAFNIEGGRLIFQKVVVESDAFYFTGSGYLAINRDLSINSNLFIPKDLSDAFIDVVSELKYLQNAQGMITMPLDIYGRFPNISVRPDLNYVIQRLAVSKGQELIEKIFRKEAPKTTEGQSAGSKEEIEPQEGQTQKEVEPAEALIKTIFDIITTPKE